MNIKYWKGGEEMKKEKNFRVKQYHFYETDPMFPFLLLQLHFSKNLYNSTLYELRQALFKHETIKNLDKVMKTKMSNRSDKPGFDYYQMATVQSAQQTIAKAKSSMEYFFRSLKKYNENPTNYTGKPKPPKYKKGKYYIVTLTNQNCKVKGNMLHFPKKYGKDFVLNINDCFNNKEYDFVKLSEVRFYLRHGIIVLEVVYQVKSKQTYSLRKNRICGIDLGVVNFAACSFNFNKSPILIDSSFIKSVNQKYNKKIAKCKSLAKKCNNLDNTKQIDALWFKRYRVIKDYMHKASTFIIQECLKHRISKIVIGENKGWKQHNQNKQNFVYIPFNLFKQMIEYKAKLYGIKVIYIHESYTSGTSFLDNELPQKKFYNSNRRVQRGLFISNSGIAINDDINAGYQMIKKYETKENNKKRRMNKKLISCFKDSLNWKLIASNVERVYIV